MNTHIIAICNQKGGVGKTTTANSIGAGLYRQGNKVLYIDLDPQTNLSYSLGITDANISIMDAFTGNKDIKDTIIKTAQGDAIASNTSLSNIDIILNGTGSEYRLKELLEPIKNDYNYIIIDTPPALNILNVNALTASTDIIITTQADIYSLQGIGQVYKTIQTIKKYCNSDLNILGVLITRYNARTIISQEIKDALEQTAKAINTNIFKTYVRECTAIKEAQANKQDIFNYKSGNNACKDYKAIIGEIKERLKDE